MRKRRNKLENQLGRIVCYRGVARFRRWLVTVGRVFLRHIGPPFERQLVRPVTKVHVEEK